MIYQFGPYELDARLFELRCAGSVCPVEPQVFDVLAYLAAHRDRVISKEELLEKLWPGRFVSETTLTSRLKAARKAVGDDGKAQSVIRTLHGRGYRFVADVRIVEGGASVVRPSAPPPAAPVCAVSAPVRPAGFVGREGELASLRAARARAAEGARQIVFVTGEAGAGKTTLVDAFLAEASTPMRVARGQCIEHRGSGEAYMPLLDALGRLCREDDAAIALLAREAPSWLAQMPWLLSDEEASALAARSGSGDRMLRELAMAVERLSEESLLVVRLEDLHWSDSATLEAIDFLARQSHPARLLLIGTFRPEDVKAARHPAYAISHELRARGHCQILELRLLGAGEIEDYLRARFSDAELASQLAPLLHERTSGNPLFAGNLVDSWIARRFLHESDGIWRLDASLETLETDVPDSLLHLIEKQVAALGEDEQRMLETASVVGREFAVAVVAAILAVDDEEIERRCEALAREGRFVSGAGTETWGDSTFTSRFAFTHDLYVDVLYDRMAPARRTRVHQQAGLALERAWMGRERERAAELALHFGRARDQVRAIRYLELAGGQAVERSAYREAVLHFTAALELLRETPPSEARDRGELRLRTQLAPSLIATRGWADGEAESNYERACELARGLCEDRTCSQMLYGMANMYEYRGEYRRAEQITIERIALDGDAATALNAIESHELLACSMMHQGRFREAAEHGRIAFSTVDAQTVPIDAMTTALLVQAHGWVSGARVFCGDPEEAIEHNRIAVALAETKGDDLARAGAHAQVAFVRFYLRHVEACRAHAETAKSIARERRLPFHLACARILAGWCLSHDDAHEEAVREVRAGIRTSLSIGARMDVPLFLAILAECQARAGDRDGALASLDEAFAHIGPNRPFFYLAELYRLSAELLRARGDDDSAHSALARAREIASEQQSPLLLARVHAAIGNVG